MPYLHNTATNYCAICYSSQGSVTLINLPCSCIGCSSCLTSWISTQSQELHYQTKEEIRCINSDCKRSFHPQQIFSQLDQNQQETISSLLLTVYVKKTLDIRTCPNSDCKYAGIIDLTACCQDYLTCKACDASWREKVHLENGNLDQGNPTIHKLNFGEILSQVREEVCTRKCPNCNVSIQKNGGCDHITCGKCSYEFCWLCSQEHSKHSFKICKVSTFVRFLFVAMFCFYLFGITGFSQGVISCIGGLVYFILNCILLNKLFILFLVVYDLAQRGKITGLVITVVLIALIALVTILWETYLDLAKIAILEAVVLGSIRICKVNLKKWIECVL